MKKYIVLLIAYTPIEWIRKNLYRLIGYKIGVNSFIGFGTVLRCNERIIGENVQIGRWNKIDVKTIHIDQNTKIGNKNIFEGYAKYSNEARNSNFIKIGKECLITSGHLIDGAYGVFIGDNTWIAGRNSSIWSHGTTKEHGSIIIGKRCYIGSDCKINTNVMLGDNVLVGMGSVITKSFNSDCMVAGVPAIVKKQNYLWYKDWK